MVSGLQSVKNERPMAIMVCGPKGAGKSTFCRLLTNALLNKAIASADRALADNECIVFLDLDPGQPEYSPPGDLSLLRLQSWNLGPPFTHPISQSNQLIRAHHYGHVSPKEHSKHYHRCALDLLDQYCNMARDYRSLPLIINTAGWIQGNGLELITDLIETMSLTDVVFMSTSGPEDVVDILQEATSRSNTELHQLISQPSDFATRTGKDLRMMQTLSYFHMSEPEGPYHELRWNDLPLDRMVPLVIHYAGPKQAILAVTILGDAPNSECLDTILENVLDGSVVGIVAVREKHGALAQESDRPGSEHEDESMPDRIANTPKHAPVLRTASGIPYFSSSNYNIPSLFPDRSFSLGQALIRGIDASDKTMHLLTPIPTNTLQSHSPNIVLVRGTLDTPTWAYKEEYEFEKAKRRVRERQLGTDEGFDGEANRKWAERRPWAGVVEGGRRSSGKVRRVRRDIRYRPVGGVSE